LLLIVTLNACNDLGEELQPLDTVPEEEAKNDNGEKNNEPTVQNVEQEIISNTDDGQYLDTGQKNSGVILTSDTSSDSVLVPIETNEDKDDNEIAQQNTSSSGSDENTKLEDSSEVEATAPEIADYDATHYELLNLAINTLAKKEYSKIGKIFDSKNFLVSPSTTFAMASFLEHSAAGKSRIEIQEDLEWEAENDWPLSTWFRHIGSSADEGKSSFNNQVWGQVDYSFSENYLTSLMNIYFADISFVDYIGLLKWIREQPEEGEAKIDLEYIDLISPRPIDELLRSKLESGISDTFLYDNSILRNALNSLSTRTRLMFTSSLLIDTTWSDDTSQISEFDGFWGAGGDRLKMPMVKWQGTFRRHDTDDFRSVIIPLADQATSITVIMPVDQASFNRVESDVFSALADIEQSYKEIVMEFVLPHFSVQTKSETADLIPSGRYVLEQEESTSESDASAATLSTPVQVESTWPYVVEEIASDYSNVNDAGYLKRNLLGSDSFLNLTTAGLKIESAALTSLDAIDDEPEYLFTGGYSEIYAGISGGAGFSTIGTSYVSVNAFSRCDIAQENIGNRQASPFIFVIKDLATDSVLQMGRITQLEGTAEYRDVCNSEFAEYEDDIWPTLPKENSGLKPHVNTSEYEPKNLFITIMPDENIIKQFVNDIYNPLAIKMYQKEQASNTVISPITNSFVRAMVQLGSTSNEALDFLTTDGTSIELKNLALHPVKTLSRLVENKTWIESDYEVVEDYLDTLSFLNNTFSVQDILHDASKLSLDVNQWTNGEAGSDVLDQLINNRTRFMFASAIKNNTLITTETFSGTFSNGQDYWPNTPMVIITGEYQSLENEEYKAVEIPFAESNVDLLIMMPGNGKFDSVEEQLLDAVSQFDNTASKKQVTVNLPELNLSQNNSDDSYQNSEYYRNASQIRPLMPRPQYTLDEFSINADGVKLVSYSMASLVAPASSRTIDGAAEFLPNVYENDLIKFCDTSEEFLASVDARPYMFILRDIMSKSILQIGRIKEPQSGLDERCTKVL